MLVGSERNGDRPCIYICAPSKGSLCAKLSHQFEVCKYYCNNWTRPESTDIIVCTEDYLQVYVPSFHWQTYGAVVARDTHWWTLIIMWHSRMTNTQRYIQITDTSTCVLLCITIMATSKHAPRRVQYTTCYSYILHRMELDGQDITARSWCCWLQ